MNEGLRHQPGFGNEHSSEAVADALPLVLRSRGHQSRGLLAARRRGASWNTWTRAAAHAMGDR